MTAAVAWIAVSPECAQDSHTQCHFCRCACEHHVRDRLLADLTAERDPPLSDREYRQLEIDRGAYRSMV